MPAINLITPLWGPLASQQAAKVLSDSNSDFLVVGVISTETQLAAQIVASLVGSPVCITTDNEPCLSLPCLQMHVSPRDRVITLDAAAMLSPHLLSSLLAASRPQPAVGSTAAAAVRAAARRAGSGSSSVPVEGVAVLLQLQLLVFLCAVCNVVVVISDHVDLHLLQLLEAAGLIAASIPNICPPMKQQQPQQKQLSAGKTAAAAAAARKQHGRQPRGALTAAAVAASMPREAAGRRTQRAGQQQQQQGAVMSVQPAHLEQPAAAVVGPGHDGGTSAAAADFHAADLLVVQSGSSSQQPPPTICLQRLRQQLCACLGSTIWSRRASWLPHQHLPTGPVPTAGVITTSSSSDSTTAGRSFEAWVIPCRDTAVHYGDALGAASGGTRLPPEAQRLVNQLLHYPRIPLHNNHNNSSSSSSGGAFRQLFSEAEWLRRAERVWDDVQDSAELLGYYREVAEFRLMGAGGWGPSASRFTQNSLAGRAW